MAEEQKQDKGHKEQPIIIKKVKKGGGHGHHGGAWKVAYADFVTAMMAFFIVMWILFSSEETKESVQYYFEHPEEFSVLTGQPSGSVPVDLGLKPRYGSGQKGEGDGSGSQPFSIKLDSQSTEALAEALRHKAVEDSIAAQEKVEEIGKDIEQRFSELTAVRPDLDKIMSSIKIEMTKEGLRIELIESTNSLFFQIGSDRLSDEAKSILTQLADKIGRLPNHVEIEGHTDSRGFSNRQIRSNWELSTERANSARRFLEEHGLWDGQIVKVTGYADRKLRNQDNPFDVSNRRVSIVIKQISAKEFLPTEAEESSTETAESQ